MSIFAVAAKILNAKLAYTIIHSLLKSNEALSDLLVVMAHVLDEDTVPDRLDFDVSHIVFG